MNLRGLNTTILISLTIDKLCIYSYLGYPPPGHAVQHFLTQEALERQFYNHICCFIEALFEHTLEVLHGGHISPDWGIKNVENHFRSLMTMGQSMNFLL